MDAHSTPTFGDRVGLMAHGGVTRTGDDTRAGEHDRLDYYSCDCQQYVLL